MRGEHALLLGGLLHLTGSPPHARGARRRCGELAVAGRITPACAGSTGTSRATTRSRGDHPRMRGEHEMVSVTVAETGGSPPHARGAPGIAVQSTESARITPACAGSTPTRSSGRWAPSDHPRMRGEHCVGHGLGPLRLGSPPHARGARWPIARPLLDARITPACAGSTSTRR